MITWPTRAGGTVAHPKCSVRDIEGFDSAKQQTTASWYLGSHSGATKNDDFSNVQRKSHLGNIKDTLIHVGEDSKLWVANDCSRKNAGTNSMYQLQMRTHITYNSCFGEFDLGNSIDFSLPGLSFRTSALQIRLSMVLPKSWPKLTTTYKGGKNVYVQACKPVKNKRWSVPVLIIDKINIKVVARKTHEDTSLAWCFGTLFGWLNSLCCHSWLPCSLRCMFNRKKGTHRWAMSAQRVC